MIKSLKRAISIVMTLVFVISLMPVVFASTETHPGMMPDATSFKAISTKSGWQRYEVISDQYLGGKGEPYSLWGDSAGAPRREVSVAGATGAKDIQLVDANGKAKTSFGVKEKFRVKVPVSSVSGTSLTINIAASATGVVYKAYEYKPTDSSMQPVTVSIPEKETVNVTAKLSLEIDSSKVSIVKVDKLTQNSIAGATLVVKDANGTVKAKWVSTTNYHVIRNLPNGTYTVEETNAPAGYLLNSTPVKFTITNTNRDIKIKFENTPRETVVNIIKIDASTKNPLAGAVLLVKDSTGATVAQFTSTTEPYVLTDLDNGTYTVEEVSAPAGYKHSTEIKTFTITDENLSHQITFENHPEVPVPDTASSSLIVTLLGIVIIGAGISFVYKNGKKAR